MSQLSTRAKVLLILGAWFATSIAFLLIFPSEGKNEHFQPQNEFKLEAWIPIEIGPIDLSINRAVLYLLLATVGDASMALFVLLAVVILSFYGGGFATVPAYLRDLFGTYQVGAIHGRLLTAWSAAGVAGPLIINAFLDAQGEPGTLTAAAYRPALPAYPQVSTAIQDAMESVTIGQATPEKAANSYAGAVKSATDGAVLDRAGG